MIKPKEITKIGLITKRSAVNSQEDYVKKLYKHLKKRRKEVFCDSNCHKFFPNERGYSKTQLLNKVEMVIVLGGDGTLLKTARRIGHKKTLVLGVNTGSVGFLTETEPEKIFDCLDKIFTGSYDIDRRSLLRATVYRDGKKIQTFLALNDAVINQGAFARLISLELEIDNRKLTRMFADGLIVATPSGSTAHSLSAGGPIIHPKVPALVITPICPTSLSMRPIVIPDNRQLKITLETQRREETAIIGLTIDGQDLTMLKFGDQIKIRRSKRLLYLIRTGNRYFRTLKNKLHWSGEI